MCRSRGNRDEQTENQHCHSDNPFISFRRYADEQVNSLMKMFGVPSHWRDDDNSDWRNQRWGCHRRRWNREDRQERVNQIPTVPNMQGDESNHNDDGESFFKMLKEMDKVARDWTREWDEAAKEWRSSAEEEWGRFLEGNASPSDTEALTTRPSHGEKNDAGKHDKAQTYVWSWSWPPSGADEKQRAVAMRDAEQHLERRWADLERVFEEKEKSIEKGDFGAWAWHFGWPDSHQETKQADANTIVPEPIQPFDKNMFDWLNSSSRSPLKLESLNFILAARVNWRDAYEDLLRTEKGLPLMSNNDLGQSAEMEKQQWAQERLGRLRGLREQQRREQVQPPIEHKEVNQIEATPALQANEDPQTELDMYEQLLSPGAKFSPVSTEAVPTSSPSSILSTLTTTERSVAPDGTVTTKVVLKKRFADGREENSESVHTASARMENASALHQLQVKPERPSVLDAVKSQEQGKPGNRGWFWSS